MSKYHHNTVVTDAEGTHYAAVDAAEQVWQAEIRAATTQAQAKAADVKRHRAIVAAANASGLGYLGGPSRAALWELTGQYV